VSHINELTSYAESSRGLEVLETAKWRSPTPLPAMEQYQWHRHHLMTEEQATAEVEVNARQSARRTGILRSPHKVDSYEDADARLLLDRK
jgi:hypothetical protein